MYRNGYFGTIGGTGGGGTSVDTTAINARLDDFNERLGLQNLYITNNGMRLDAHSTEIRAATNNISTLRNQLNTISTDLSNVATQSQFTTLQDTLTNTVTRVSSLESSRIDTVDPAAILDLDVRINAVRDTVTTQSGKILNLEDTATRFSAALNQVASEQVAHEADIFALQSRVQGLPTDVSTLVTERQLLAVRDTIPDLSSYLTRTTADSLYLTPTDASSTYATQSALQALQTTLSNQTGGLTQAQADARYALLSSLQNYASQTAVNNAAMAVDDLRMDMNSYLNILRNATAEERHFLNFWWKTLYGYTEDVLSPTIPYNRLPGS